VRHLPAAARVPQVPAEPGGGRPHGGGGRAAGPARPLRTACPGGQGAHARAQLDRKSTRLNSSHVKISYAVFCLKKKNKRYSRRGKREPRNLKAGEFLNLRAPKNDHTRNCLQTD